MTDGNVHRPSSDIEKKGRGPSRVPEGIAGLDTADGLRRVLGNEELYLSLLAQFADGQKDAPARIRGALERGEAKAASIIAHTLKGVAGNIGATDIYALAAGLEREINDGRPRESIESSLEAICAPLEKLVKALENVTPPPDGPDGTDDEKAAAGKAAILVVDDAADNVTLIGGILGGSYAVKAATDGAKALEIAAGADPPDLILLDIVMPGMDGYEVCRRLKRNAATCKIPVIFITARNEEIDELSGFDSGAVDYVAKPISPSILMARVRTHLALADARKQLERQNAVLAENVRLRENIEKITRHDLKAPLTGFINIPEALGRSDGLNAEQKEMLDALGRSACRMLETINRSLDLCKMEMGTYRPVMAPVNMVKLAYLVFHQYDRLAGGRGVKCSLAANGRPASREDVFELSGEEFLFFSLLSNLVKNAVEASPENGEVRVSLFDSPLPGISVKNRGTVPAQIRDRVFERYATFGKEGGTGLGLYSARLMARTLGGDLGFESSEAGGTVFTVTLAASGEKEEKR